MILSVPKKNDKIIQRNFSWSMVQAFLEPKHVGRRKEKRKSLALKIWCICIWKKVVPLLINFSNFYELFKIKILFLHKKKKERKEKVRSDMGISGKEKKMKEKRQEKQGAMMQ